MKKWPTQKLEQLTTKIGSGATPRGGQNGYVEAGVSLIRSQNILDNGMNIAEIAHITDEAAHKLRGVTVQANDVLINITGDSIARCSIVDERVLPARVNQHVSILRTTAELDPLFLQKFLVTPGTKNLLMAISSGGTRQALTRSDLANLSVPVPPISEQRAIAEVLGALDDKIAANNNLARLTNDLADSVFRQALLKAEFSNETFADISRVSGGGTPSTKQPEYWNGDVLWATPTDVTALMAPYLEGTSRTITEEGLSACASELYPAGTILMTSRATIGSFALTQFPTAVNQGFIVVQPTDKNLRYWIFHEMRSRVAEFTAFANGATFLELSRGNFKNFRVRQAPYDVMVKFNETAGSLHKLGRAALVENQTLSSVRDTLLPQLMSGKIRVRDAEAIVEDVL